MYRLIRQWGVARRFVQGTLFTALAAISLISAAAAAEPQSPLELQQLLLDRDFDRLEAILAEVEDRYLAEQAPEYVVRDAYAAFASVNALFEARLDDWADARPTSHHPFLARAIFQQNIGWVVRGTDTIGKTTDEQLALMQDRFSRAAADFKLVLERKPQLGLTYSYLIGMLMTGGDDAAIDRLVEAGLQADPRSYSIRKRYLYSLTPWWSGSRQSEKSLMRFLVERYRARRYPVFVPAEMLDFAERIERDARAMPSLKPLLGFVDYIVGETLIRSGKREAADQFYRRANEIAGDTAYLSAVAANLYWMDRDDEALEIFNRLLAANPHHKDALLYRARIYWVKDNKEEALTTLDRALALSPNDPTYVWLKSAILFRAGQRDEAIAQFDDALVYGSFNAALIHARGMMHLDNTGGKNTKAEDDLRRATELRPTSAKYWYDYGKALSYRLQCSATDAYRMYIDLCPHYGNRCRDEDLEVALNYVNDKTIAKYCFTPSSPA